MTQDGDGEAAFAGSYLERGAALGHGNGYRNDDQVLVLVPGLVRLCLGCGGCVSVVWYGREGAA